MTRQEARDRAIELGATCYRYTLIEKRNRNTGEVYFETWEYIEYYFNAADAEVGYYNDPCSVFHEFQVPRLWSTAILMKMTNAIDLVKY